MARKLNYIPDITDALDEFVTPARVVLCMIAIAAAVVILSMLGYEGRLLNGKLRGDAAMPEIAREGSGNIAAIASVLDEAAHELKMDRQQKRSLESQVYQQRLDMEDLKGQIIILEGRLDIVSSEKRRR